MAMKKALTDRSVASMKVPATGQLDVFDQGYHGLALRLSYAGSRSFVLFHTQHGKTRRITLGTYPAMTLSEAREVWRQARNGQLPTMTAVSAPAVTFEAVFEEWLARDQAGNKSARESEMRIRKHVLPYWRTKNVTAIGRRDVLDVLDRIVDSGAATMSRRVHAILHRLFAWAVGRGIVTANPLTGIEKHGAETRRERVLSDAELVKVWNGDAGDPYSAAIKLLILTGARKAEIGELKWSEVDLEAGTITLSNGRTKNGKAHIIPLSQPARQILAAMPRVGDYVVTLNGSKPVNAWDTAVEKLRADSGVAEWHVHDLRRTVATGMQKLGTPLPVTESVLGHVSGSRAGVVGIYQRHDYANEKRAALEAWGAHVIALVDGSVRGKVLPIRRA
jgi:integrase